MATQSSITPPFTVFVYDVSFNYSALNLHSASASIPVFSFAAITCPLDIHLLFISTTPPVIRGLDQSPHPSKPLIISSQSHSYNICSHASQPPEIFVNFGLGLASPACSSKSTRGQKSHISMAIHQARVEMAHGRESTLDWVLRAPSTHPLSPP